MAEKVLVYGERLLSIAPRLTVLSYGAGQDSSALLVLYVEDPAWRAAYAPNDFLVVFSDTGNEHPETYAHIEATKKYCLKHGIEFVHIEPSMGYHTGNWKDLLTRYRSNNSIGAVGYNPTCTWHLKLKPIYNFLEDYIKSRYGLKGTRKRAYYEFMEEYGAPVRVLVGIASGEDTRIPKKRLIEPVYLQEATERRWPLFEMGADRAACHELLKSTPVPINPAKPLPPPSNCMICFYMSDQEMVWLHRFHPDVWDMWVELEANKIQASEEQRITRFMEFNGDPFDKKNKKGNTVYANNGVKGTKLLPEKLEAALKRYGHWTDEQLNEYKMSHGHCVKSQY